MNQIKIISLKHIYILLGLSGLILSAFLWKQTIDFDPSIPCTAFSDCTAVITGEYSKFLGVPVAAFGFFYYSFVLLISIQRAFIKSILLDKMLFALLLWGIIFSVYLRYLEFVKIGHICIWCWGSVVIILLLTAIYILEQNKSNKSK